MAVAGENVLAPATGLDVKGFLQGPNGRNVLLMVGAAAIVAIMAGVMLWSQRPEYRVLFANFSDRDGGAIVASLQQLNIPYQFADGGGAILVPADQVHDARLKLAAQGLPKGGNVGFELMENQRLGVSQFHEQVNFQRALEGELARSIEAIAQVASARVHLALPKATVFVRDKQQPTASVLINLHPGRFLDQQQVSAVVHLIASSVPELPPKNVSVIDQNGNLLSQTERQPGVNGLDPGQLKYVQELQQSIVKRIESIITPIVGANNVRAEATADVDFSHSEQAAEIYKPNQEPNSGTVRSQQSSESINGAGNGPSGVPGALSNQPPTPATAPLTVPPTAGTGAAPGATVNAPTSVQKDVTVNYEVDKTVRYVQQPMGGVKRLSVAVVVNYKRVTDKDGKVTMQPLTDAEKNQITDLVKEAMGFNRDRGDSLNVVNSPFAGADKVDVPPIWERPEAMLEIAGNYWKYPVAIIIFLILYFKLLRPLLRRISDNLNPPPAAPVEEIEEDSDEGVEVTLRGYEQNLQHAKQLARDDPKLVANVVKSWVDTNE